MSKSTRRIPTTGVILFTLLVSFGLRVFRLDAQSLWWDEGISLHLATATVAEIFADRVTNIHPPLYFLVLKGWVALVGESPFAGRYLSTLASLLQVAAVFALSRQWFGRVTACVGMLLIALSPLSIIYGQEIRVYAMLPLVYLVLLALTYQLVREPANIMTAGETKSRFKMRRSWVWLGVVSWIGLHLHYIVFFVLLYVSGWMFWAFYRQKRWSDLRRWGVVQLAVAIASLPWFLTVAFNWMTIQAEANAGTFLTEPVPFQFLVSQVWVFHLTGLAGALGQPEARWLAGLVASFSTLLFLLRLLWSATRGMALRYFAHWFIPLSSAMIVWSVRSFAHPRYVSTFAIGAIPLLAYLMMPGSMKQMPGLGNGWKRLLTMLSAVLGICVVLLSIWALGRYYFDEDVAKDDMRGVARHLEGTATADDLILVPDTDWSLPFEYKGEAMIAMPRPSRPDELWDDLGQWTASRRRVFVVDYRRGIRDWQGLVPFALDKAGTLMAETKFDNLFVRSFQLDAPVTAPTLVGRNTRFGPLMLTGTWTETDVPADSAVTIALNWLSPQPLNERYRITLALIDADGYPLAVTDDELVDQLGRPTDHWIAGDPITNYHLLAIPPGTPPLSYEVALGIYKLEDDRSHAIDILNEGGVPVGRELLIADVQLTPPLGLLNNPYQVTINVPALAEPETIADGLQLIGSSIDRQTIGPGQSLLVHLRWTTTKSPLPDLRPRLALMQAGQELVATDDAPALGRYPTDEWGMGEVVVEHRRLIAPPSVDGSAEILLTLGERRLILGEVDIIAESTLFEPPDIPFHLDVQFGQVAQLVGYDLPHQVVNTAEPVHLTLFWRSLATGMETDYTVFAHMLASDGRLIGQHDSPPANARRPTRGWLMDEYIIDPHRMTFRELGYEGEAQIEVGLYDPDTGARLMTDLGHDFVYLPVELEVQP